jgi:hypothetical protein
LVKNFKTELKSWLQSLEELTKLCHESKSREAKTATLSEELTSCRFQVTELRGRNLALSVIHRPYVLTMFQVKFLSHHQGGLALHSDLHVAKSAPSGSSANRIIRQPVLMIRKHAFGVLARDAPAE